jgi:hypothetical protein
MSGAETVIGLVLGVLPLLVSTAEHYDDVLRPFKRYKRFSKELKKFQQEFLGHKTVFHNECLLLLSTFTGVETASEMLWEKDHPLRKDLDLNKKLSDQLGPSRDACQDTIRLIMGELDGIQLQSRSFELAMPEDVPVSGQFCFKAWRQEVGAKLKFCISETRLDQRLNRLKNYNRVLGRLSAQTKELHNCRKSTDVPKSPPRSDQRRLKECMLVRDAAIQLYNALVDACASHPEHLAHFRLDPQHEVQYSPPRVRFDIAFAQNLLEGRSHDADPIWFAIESMFNETLMKEPDIQPEEVKEAWCDFKNTLKRAIKQDSTPAVPAKKQKPNKSVTFAITSPTCKSRSIIQPPTLPPQISMKPFIDSSLPNFCIGRDFCNYVRRCSKQALSSSDICIGYLQRSGTCSHLVYYKHPKSHTETNAVVTLAQIFSSISAVEPGRKQSKRMLQCESLRLARQLASAVLQFHETPILKESWRSEDVVFFGENTISILKPEHPDMKTPHLNVRVRTMPGKSNSTATNNSFLNTNPYTFGLGILLLELAYQTPFNDLRLLDSSDSLSLSSSPPPSLPPSRTSSFTLSSATYACTNPIDDFSLADRLSRSLSSEMGVPYARMVRKCLACDFGQGTRDLADEGLREAFYRDVVCELERLEDAFGRLQLGGGGEW